MDTREMLERIIKCEVGCDADVRAFATVVMNRVHVTYGEYYEVYQDRLRCVIEEMCQFSLFENSDRQYQNI